MALIQEVGLHRIHQELLLRDIIIVQDIHKVV